MKKIKKRIMLVATIFGMLVCSLGFTEETEAVMVEGAYNGINYTAQGVGSPMNVYTKFSTSQAANLSGTMSGNLNAYLGVACGHSFQQSFSAIKSTYAEDIYYVDAQHTILNASFVWKINGTTVDRLSITVDPY